MNPAEAITLVLAIVLGTGILGALLVSVTALFPRVVERTRSVADASPRRAFAIGVVNALFLSVLFVALGALAERVPVLFALPTIVVAAAILIGVSFGAAAMGRLVGQRMWPDRSAYQQTLFGAVVLTLGCLMPIVGWFGLLPYVIALGLGAFVVGLFGRAAPQA